MTEERCDRCGHLRSLGVVQYMRASDHRIANRHLCEACGQKWDAMTDAFFVHEQAAKEGEGDA